MTIEQIQRRLAAEFPGQVVSLVIEVNSPGESRITISKICPFVQVKNCRSIANAIESLKEKMAPVNIGHVEITA